MVAMLDVLHVGYADDRVAGTVVAIRDGDFVAVLDPGMVASRDRILGPLGELGVQVGDVTDVVFSHHHPDHTLNAALFPVARFHDFQATYQDDLWIDREFIDGTSRLSPSVRMLFSPGHSAEDVSTAVETAEGLVVCTHLWWTKDGPADDPFAADRDLLRASREMILALQPTLIVPGHGAPFSPTDDTPR